MNLLKSLLYRSDIEKTLLNLDMRHFENKTFLITGGLGLICSSIVDLLVEYEMNNQAGIHIIVADRNKLLFDKKNWNSSVVEYYEYEAMNDFEFSQPVDYIIHGAGLASPEKYTSSPVETMLTNINGIRNLLEYCKNNSVKRIIYISSSEVYGINEKIEPYKEDDYGLVNIDYLRSSYPIAKRASEMLCRSYTSEYGVNAVIVRPGHIFGPSASENDKRISSEFAYKAAKGETLELKSSGVQKRSYMYSLDCAKAILLVLMRGKPCEAYNIGAETVITIKEMASYYADAGNVQLKVAEASIIEKQAFNPMNNASLDITKIKELGYRDSFSIKDGLMHTVIIFKEILCI